MREFYYLFPGMAFAAGPVRAANEAAARREIRESCGLARLPSGTDVWRTSPKERAETLRQARRFNRDLPGWARGPA